MVSARRRRRTVIPLPFRIYFHQECLTSKQGDGVVEVEIPMVISRSTRSGWVLDCLDLTDLHAVYCKQTRAKRRSSLAPVLRKAAEMVEEQKINPRHVRGWTRWFPNDVVAQVWAELRV